MHHLRPARLDPLHVSTVSNSTFVRYQSAVEKFETFLLLFDAVPSSAAELDEWLVLYRREAALTRSKLETTLAGIQFFAPCLRGNLPLTKKVIKGLAIEFPSKHAFPMLSRSAKFIACKLADGGEYRLGVCMLLQQATGLRPSEMLGLREHDVLRPNELVPRYVLRLGTNVGTKVGREQTAFNSSIQIRTRCLQCYFSDCCVPLPSKAFWQTAVTIIIGECCRVSALCWECITLLIRAGLASRLKPSSRASCRLRCRGEAVGTVRQAFLCTSMWQPLCKWKQSFGVAPWTLKFQRRCAVCFCTSQRVVLQVTRMGLPVVVPIEDASADEDSPTAPASQAQPGSTQRRSRVMTPPPQPRVVRPSAQRRRVDGTAVLSPSLRAHLASRAGSAAGAAESARPEPLRRGPQRRKQPSGLNYVWKFCSRWLQRLRALLLWGSLAFVLASGPVRDLLVPVQRLMVSTAQVGESAAGALTSLLDGGTQLVTASTSVVRAASVNTLSVAQAAWEGVDLVGMNATNVIGRVLGASAAAIEQWLYSAQGREVLRDPAPSVLDFWVGLLKSQGLHTCQWLLRRLRPWWLQATTGLQQAWSLLPPMASLCLSSACSAWTSLRVGLTRCGKWLVGTRRMSMTRFSSLPASLQPRCQLLTVPGTMCCPSLPPRRVGTLLWACAAASVQCCFGRFARAAASSCPCGSMGPCIR